MGDELERRVFSRLGSIEQKVELHEKLLTGDKLLGTSGLINDVRQLRGDIEALFEENRTYRALVERAQKWDEAVERHNRWENMLRGGFVVIGLTSNLLLGLLTLLISILRGG